MSLFRHILPIPIITYRRNLKAVSFRQYCYGKDESLPWKPPDRDCRCVPASAWQRFVALVHQRGARAVRRNVATST